MKIKKPPLSWKRLGKGLIFTFVFTNLAFTACQKEDESEDPYNQTTDNTDNESYYFTNEEQDLLLYNVNDSFNLIYDDYDTLLFKVMAIDIDTLTNSNSVKYEQVIVRFQRKIYDEFYEMGFVFLSKETGTLNYKLTLSTSYPATNQTIPNKIAEKYTSLEIDSLVYQNVYRVEDEAVSNDEHICNIKRAYVSPEKGIIQLIENCHTYKIFE